MGKSSKDSLEMASQFGDLGFLFVALFFVCGSTLGNAQGLFTSGFVLR